MELRRRMICRTGYRANGTLVLEAIHLRRFPWARVYGQPTDPRPDLFENPVRQNQKLQRGVRRTALPRIYKSPRVQIGPNQKLCATVWLRQLMEILGGGGGLLNVLSEEVTEPGAIIKDKRMFGGLAIIVNGHMCCGIVGNMSLSYAWPQTNGSEPFRNHTLAQWISLAGRCAASSTLTQPDSGPRFNSELGFNEV